MDKDSRYGVIALSALLVSGAVFGTYVYFAGQTIEASSNSVAESQTSSGVPLKIGENDFTNGDWSITEESQIIGINGSLMSVSQAFERGIITKITDESGKLILGENEVKIDANVPFVVYAADTTNSPAVFIQTREQ